MLIQYLNLLRWQAEDGGVDPTPKSRNVNDTGDEEGHIVRILITDLMPGVKYAMEIQTVSYNLHSDTTKLSTRTSKCVLKIDVLFKIEQTCLHTYHLFS